MTLTDWIALDRKIRALLAERMKRGATDALDAKIMALAKEQQRLERSGAFS